MRSEKRVDTRDQPIEIMVMKKRIIHGTNKDPKLLVMAGVASALANADNVGKMVDDLEQYKEKMSQMKETLRKERGEGKILKRKHDDSLIELERLKEAYQILQSDKDALVLSANITEGEKKNLERKVLELENKKDTADKRIEELEIQNSLLDKQIKVCCSGLKTLVT